MEVRALATPIDTEQQYDETVATYEAVLNEGEKQTTHPLNSLAGLL